MQATIYKRSKIDLLGNLSAGWEPTAIAPDKRRHEGVLGIYELPPGWTVGELEPPELTESGPVGQSGICGPSGAEAIIMSTTGGTALVLSAPSANGIAAFDEAVAPRC